MARLRSVIPGWLAPALRDGAAVAAVLFAGGLTYLRDSVNRDSSDFAGLIALGVMALIVLLRGLYLVWARLRRLALAAVLLLGLALLSRAGWRWWVSYQEDGYSSDVWLCLVGFVLSATLAVVGFFLALGSRAGQDSGSRASWRGQEPRKRGVQGGLASREAGTGGSHGSRGGHGARAVRRVRRSWLLLVHWWYRWRLPAARVLASGLVVSVVLGVACWR